MDMQSLQRHKAYIDAAGGHGVICMFDMSAPPGTAWPRTGRATGNVDKLAQAWKNVHGVFASYGDKVMYEILNEPWGYKADAVTYLSDMRSIIQMAGLPENRTILAGLYGSADVQSVARAGWGGYLSYHVYSFWLPEGQKTWQRFSDRIRQDLAGLSSRVFITEFGVGLDRLDANIDRDDVKIEVMRHVDTESFTSDWQDETGEEHIRAKTSDEADLKTICAKYPTNKWCHRVMHHHASFAQSGAPNNVGADVAAHTAGGVEKQAEKALEVYQNETMGFLRGVRHALLKLKQEGHGINGLYHWHGWHNGDTWDFWDAQNARSSHMIQMIMSDLGESTTSEHDDPFLSDDFMKDDGPQVHMLVARGLGPQPVADCPSACAAQTCQPGNPAQIGGKHLTDNVCTHTCSMPYNGMRYCGAGSGYQGPGTVDCGACARPAMCAGLPCWSEDRPAQPQGGVGSSRAAFLQKHQ
jgi:hypothetical protein